MRGKAHKFDDDVNTDYIISGKYKFKTLDMRELAKHLFEDLAPDFYERIEPGDMIVAGENFGYGSSREQAPLVIREAGVSCVVARSFARIFYRNAINVGLPVVECDTTDIKDGDVLEVDLKDGELKNSRSGLTLKFKPLPAIMGRILKEGGLARYLRVHGNLPTEEGI